MTEAMVSGGVALFVAVLGIGGAIAAQVVATRRAFANSLALFERQAAEAQQARNEAARIEDRHRFADQKRGVYSRTLRLADELVSTRDAERGTRKNLDRIARTLARAGNQSESLVQSVKDHEAAVVDSRLQARRLAVELAETIGEIHLLSEQDVRATAERLQKSAQVATHVEESGYLAVREAFLRAARYELGVETS